MLDLSVIVKANVNVKANVLLCYLCDLIVIVETSYR